MADAVKLNITGGKPSMTQGDTLTLKVIPLDKHNQVGTITSVPHWTSSDPNLGIGLSPSADGLTCTAHAIPVLVGLPGTYKITCTANSNATINPLQANVTIKTISTLANAIGITGTKAK